MNKLAIPAILTATIMVAGMFAFMPVEQASTVHTTLSAQTTGIACATEAVNLLATSNNDILTFTFTQPILIISIEMQGAANLAADTIGFDAATIDGEDAILTLGLIDGETLDDDPDLNWVNEGPFTNSPIYVGATLAITIDDDAGGETDVDDDITFVICGLVEDATSFDGTDVTAVQTAV